MYLLFMSDSRIYWVSCSKFTVKVRVTNGIIRGDAPFITKFIGQSFDNLLKWAEKFGSVQVKEITNE